MANSSHPSRRPVEELRLTIDCLPVPTREAMLDGISGAERIIVGAYTDREGGMCPMLAARRSGGPTSLLSFSRSWDRFARAGRKVRAATPRELEILIDQLEGSLLSEAPLDLARAIEEHRELLRGSMLSREALAAAADPRGEIHARGRAKRFGRRVRHSVSGKADRGDAAARPVLNRG